MKQFPPLLPELYSAPPNNSDVCTSPKSDWIMPERPPLVQKPGCRLPVKGLLYASTPGELQGIQLLPSPHTLSPLLPAPNSPHSHAKDQFSYWFTTWYGLKQTPLYKGFFLRQAKIHCRQPKEWCCCKQNSPILQDTV